MRTIIPEIEFELNKLVNKLILKKNEFIDLEIKSKLDVILKNYHDNRKIYDWKINSNYPNVEIYVQEYRGQPISEIKLLRFQRHEKLSKIDLISKSL